VKELTDVSAAMQQWTSQPSSTNCRRQQTDYRLWYM